jgi:hypothetical protein
MPRQFTPEPHLVDTSALIPAHPDLIDNYELSPDHNFDPVDTYERSPDAFTPEFSSDHNSDRFHTPTQSPEELMHASSPSPHPRQGQIVETHCKISFSRSLKPMVEKTREQEQQIEGEVA